MFKGPIVTEFATFEDGSRGEIHSVSLTAKNEPLLIFERRNNFLGQPNTLSARPLVVNDDHKTLFISRGCGLHANSMVAGVYAKLGEFLADAEKLYDVSPVLQQNGMWTLSRDDFNKLDVNTALKYRAFTALQTELKKYLELERSVDPNDQRVAGAFKTALLQRISSFRNDMIKTPGHSVTEKHSDDILFEAEKLITSFAWPLDSDDASRTRRTKITEADQLHLDNTDKNNYFLLDFAKAFPGGMNAQQRDTVTHCVAAQKKLKTGDRNKFIDIVQKNVKPSMGIGFSEVDIEIDRKSTLDDNLFMRGIKNTFLYGPLLLGKFLVKTVFDAILNFPRLPINQIEAVDCQAAC